MGRKDIITKEYMEDTEVFADVFNHMIYQGEKVIDPKNLKELDTASVVIPYGADGAEVPYQKYRDVFKILCAMEDENAVYLLLGVENQSNVHYAMPVKNMVYDSLEYAAQVQKEVLGAKDIMDAWRGMIAEQIVAQELLTLTDKVSQKRCFWVRNKSGSNAEVDYVWVQDSMVYPIEVKSGHNAHLRSLHSFMNHSNQTVAVRIWSQPYAVDEVKTADGKEFKLINLPFYLVGKLDSILRRFETTFDNA